MTEVSGDLRSWTIIFMRSSRTFELLLLAQALLERPSPP
jgi:hypothetical protein